MTIIKHRRGTAAEWTASNRVLSDGEIGFERDRNRIKIGNGVSTWSQLDYIIDESLVAQLIEDHTERVDNPHAVTKTQLGLGNVDNTSDANKPISTATAAALAAREMAGTAENKVNEHEAEANPHPQYSQKAGDSYSGTHDFTGATVLGISSEGGSGGAVDSVNGKVGVVTLDSSDVGAIPSGEVTAIEVVTQAEYDALVGSATTEATTLYVVQG